MGVIETILSVLAPLVKYMIYLGIFLGAVTAILFLIDVPAPDGMTQSVFMWLFNTTMSPIIEFFRNLLS